MSDDVNDLDMDDLKRRMEGALNSLKGEFAGLRTGRASPALLDNITLEAYGAPTPLNQIGTVSVPESRMLSVNIWDKANVAAADKAIRESGLGLNPVVDGQNLRIPIPALNEERRAELAKMAGKYTETARVAVRNIRRDGMDTLKRMEKAGDLSQDEQKAFGEDVQKLTDDMIAKIDESLKSKEEEIMQV
ncbi:MAG: ribosome recycling factor [Pseudomonadota bacterium]